MVQSVFTKIHLFLFCLVALSGVSGCDRGRDGGSAPVAQAPVAPAEPTLSDQPLSEPRQRLLRLAYEVATMIPTDPHIKDRSKAQEAVVKACLELGQAEKALEFTEGIENWRRGVGYADLAFYCAQNDLGSLVREYLDKAEKVSETAEDWRRDRIRVRIAQVHAVLGQNAKAETYASDVVESETGKLAGTKAEYQEDKDFDELVEELDALIKPDVYDVVNNSLKSYALLFNRYYDNAERRDLCEQKIKDSWTKLPVNVRIDLLMTMADYALERDDNEKALALVEDAQAFLDNFEWRVEHKVPLWAKVIRRRFAAGDTQRAASDAGAALEYYNDGLRTIVDIYRAETLTPLAEAYYAMGDREKALAVYGMALKEGSSNPNARPRAEDLSATCLSLALNGVELGPDFWDQVHQIRSGLVQPW